jgi:hypothetical protein
MHRRGRVTHVYAHPALLQLTQLLPAHMFAMPADCCLWSCSYKESAIPGAHAACVSLTPTSTANTAAAAAADAAAVAAVAGMCGAKRGWMHASTHRCDDVVTRLLIPSTMVTGPTLVRRQQRVAAAVKSICSAQVCLFATALVARCL